MSDVIDPDEVLEACESGDYIGFCKVCGESQYGCEPDARNYECEACGECAVFGAEELLIEGYAG
jgi:hypothetical protein